MIHELLSRLNKVRQTGKDKWKACCPSHHDRNPSLDIALGDDGRILWHCKAGCGQYKVSSAVGLTSLGSFPKHEGYSKPNKNAFPTTDVLRCVRREAFIVLIAALTSVTQTEEDLDRLKTAASSMGASYE